MGLLGVFRNTGRTDIRGQSLPLQESSVKLKVILMTSALTQFIHLSNQNKMRSV